MKKFYLTKFEIFTIIFCLIPILFGVFCYSELPENMAIHFNMKNIPDRYASKNFVVFGMPVILTILQAFCCISSKLRNEKKCGSEKVMILVRLIIPVLSFITQAVIIAFALNEDTNISFWISLPMGLIFIIIGNFMPKLRPNTVIGIKFPWIMKNEFVWEKTHRFAGLLFILNGFFIVIMSLLNKSTYGFIFLFATIIFIVIYSIVIRYKIN